MDQFTGRRPGNVLLFLVLMALLPVTALGHQGLYEEKDTTGFQDAIVLPKPVVSYAVYMRLDYSGDVDYVSFKVDGPMPIKVSLLVPQRSEFLDYYPVFAVVGPGLPAPDPELPCELPIGYGAVIMKSEPQAPREKFYEPFSNTRYYQGFKIFEQVISEPGTYYIVIWHPEGEYGDHVVTYGEKESFTPKEMLNTYRVMSKVWSGKWGKFRGYPSKPQQR